MTSAPPRSLATWRATLVLLASVCAAVVLLDVLTLFVAVADADLEVSLETLAVEAVLLAAGVAVLAAFNHLSARSNGGGIGVLFVGAGVATGIFVVCLAWLWPFTPVCDFTGGDACSPSTAAAPPWYAVPRSLLILAAVCLVVALLTQTGRVEAWQWLRRNRGPAPEHATRPASVPLVWCAAAGVAVCAVNLLAVRQRIASTTSTSEFRVSEAAAQAYGTALWLTGFAILLGVAASLVAVVAWRGSSRFAGHVRTFGGLVCAGQLMWSTAALGSNPAAWQVNAGLADLPSTLPGWYPPTLATLLASLALAALVTLVLLPLAGLRHRT